ncbi:LysE family translocator [Chelativorans sp. J32]|jgi:Putative threonine efflux protein|uniref:LysE family translocator n=1 Tax=Chelativorans sp. J32 TaxID=935840 RepID=UPI0004898EB1|nr:LysE family translocator [Chelativorans sp. J32]
MSSDMFAALLVFSFVSSITPGPNNLMLLTSGLNFGFVRTIPHMLGIGVGFVSLLLAVGFGLGALLMAVPQASFALKTLGSIYLLYLAWKIAMSRAPASGAESEGRPMSFLQAAAFQWVNPKAWVMAVTAMAIYTDPKYPLASLLLVAFAFGLVNLPSVSLWAGLGVALRGFLADPVRLKWFNILMGLALAATLWPMLR